MAFHPALAAGAVLGVAALASNPALAQGVRAAAAPAATQAQVDALNQQIQALQGQLDTLRSSLGKEIKAIDRKVGDSATVTLANGRPRFQSADKAFDIALRTRFHVDYGWWFPDQGFAGQDLPDGFNVRRAYIGLSGTVFNDWGFEVVGDFAGRANSSGRLRDALLTYKGVDGWAVDLGVTQPSFTLMDSVSSNDIPFIERPMANNLATSIVAGEQRLAAGVRHWGERYRVSAYVTGDQVGTAARDDQAALIGRASVLAATGPAFDVHLGASAGYLYEPGASPTPGPRGYGLSERPETRIGGGGYVPINTGAIDTDEYAVYGAEFGATYGPAWVMAEYYRHEFSRRDALPDVGFHGWYVGAGWFVTGERRPYSVAGGSFGSPRVAAPFKTTGGFGPGAWEVVARYSVADLDDNAGTAGAPAPAGGIRGGEAEVVTLGVNWYANAAVRFMVNYNIIDIQRLTAAGGDGDQEADALTLRAQFQF